MIFFQVFFTFSFFWSQYGKAFPRIVHIDVLCLLFGLTGHFYSLLRNLTITFLFLLCICIIIIIIIRFLWGKDVSKLIWSMKRMCGVIKFSNFHFHGLHLGKFCPFFLNENNLDAKKIYQDVITSIVSNAIWPRWSICKRKRVYTTNSYIHIHCAYICILWMHWCLVPNYRPSQIWP